MAKLEKQDRSIYKRYFVAHRLPEIYEALMSGIIVMCPPDAYQFIIDKLRYLKEHGLSTMQWDMFIDEQMKPKKKPLGESNLDWLFDMEDDEALQPTSDMLEKAYSFTNSKSKQKCFRAWMRHHLLKRKRMIAEVDNTKKAAEHLAARSLRVHFQAWVKWTKFHKGRQAVAFNIIQRVYAVAFCRIVIESWHNLAVEAEKTRQYFENADLRALKLSSSDSVRVENGGNMDDDEVMETSNGDARDDISSLDRKVAFKIFSYVDLCDLGRCAQVCRSWKVITQVTTLWNRVNLSEIKHRLDDKTAIKILDGVRTHVSYVNLLQCSLIGAPTFHAIARCRNLQDLNLSQCHSLNDDLFTVVANGCRVLLYLNVSYTKLTDASLRVISQQLHNLQFLSLAYCEHYTDRGLVYVSRGHCASRLLHLDLSGCVQISADGFNAISQTCVNIHTLVLDSLPQANDKHIKEFVTNCKHLQCLSLLGTPNLSDEFFCGVAALKKLQQFKIRNNHQVTDNAFKDIGRNWSALRLFCVADCSNLSDATLKHLSPCRNIVALNLADCARITDTGLRHICDGPSGNRLRELNVTNCVNLSDASILSIHRKCHALAYISLCFCERITEPGVELLGQMQGLVSVDLSGCNCTDAGLFALGNITRLRDLSLAHCSQITDLGVQKFSQLCTELERINLTDCHLITDASIKSLAFSCRLLSHIVLAGCNLLTDLSVKYLTGVCHSIRYLDLSSAERITDKSMKYIKKSCKELRTLIIMHCCGLSRPVVSKMARSIPVVQFSNDRAPVLTTRVASDNSSVAYTRTASLISAS